jgi:hypothetical protein
MPKMIKITGHIFLFVIAFAFLFSCKKDNKDNEPGPPQISYKNFVKYGNDSAHIVIHFKDGDGNIGNSFPSTDTCADNDYFYYNLRVYYQYDSAGIFKYLTKQSTVPSCRNVDTVQNSVIIPDIEPRGQNKFLEGDIIITLSVPYYRPQDETIHYVIFMFDKAKNKSNVITTPNISTQ